MQTLNSFPSLNWCLWFRWMLTFFIQIVQHLVVVVSCPVHLGPVILLGCLREFSDLQMWLTFYKKFNGTKTFPSLNWCLWLKWMETFFYSDSSVSRGFTNGLKVVRNHPITDSEVILHIDNVALTSLCSQK